MGRWKGMGSRKGRRMYSITGRSSSPAEARLPAIKFQYLKKPSSARLKITEEATAILAPRSFPLALHRSTSRPWVKSMAVDRNMMST